MPPDPPQPRFDQIAAKLSAWLRFLVPKRAFYRIDNERLEGALGQFSVRLESLKGLDHAPSTQSWLSQADKYCSQARTHRDTNQLNAAWSALKAAERALVGCLQTYELLIEARRVAAEANKKLEGWRREATDAIWPANTKTQWTRERLEAGGLDDLRLEVMHVRRFIDDAADNMYWKQDYQRSQLRRSAQAVFIMLLTMVVVIAVVLWRGWSVNSGASLVADMRSLVVVIALGGLGASLSGLLTVSQRDLSQAIPEIRAQWMLIRYRPIIGAVSAIAVVGILQSGIGGISVEPEAAVIAAFLAGFSERLVSGAVGRASSALSQ
jgi:hypothetical protein